jgi:hypothetical protein
MLILITSDEKAESCQAKSSMKNDGEKSNPYSPGNLANSSDWHAPSAYFGDVERAFRRSRTDWKAVLRSAWIVA